MDSAWTYEEARKRALNVAMHLRPRHRRWIEELVSRADKFREELEKEREDMKDLLYELEVTGLLQELHSKRTAKAREKFETLGHPPIST